MSRRRRGPKKIVQTALLSELGVNLVARRVMEMGHAWHPTTAAFDAGIDGFIELRDPNTSEALNLIVQVQVKATEGRWANESVSSFEFVCDERDLAHWRRGNAPVVLVVTRPGTEEAYWASIKDYFKNPLALRSNRVRFDKARDKFDASIATALHRLAVPPEAGLHVGPLTKPESLISNLLRVRRLPPRLYAADTQVPKRFAVTQALGENARVMPEFVYRSKRILSVHDLGTPEWKDVVDAGTVEPFDTDEWSLSDDDERVTDFTELLGRCLSQRAQLLDLVYSSSREMYFYKESEDLKDYQVSYVSVQQQARRWVFKKYTTKRGFEYYRHSAFEAQFRRYDGDWYLSITPTYHFTEDGRNPLRFYESKLKGIKALERNSAVLGQVVFFASVLADPPADLFNDRPPYPFLGFGELTRFSIDVGLDDAAWLPTDEEKAAREHANDDDLAIVAEEESLPVLFGDSTYGEDY